jgi:DNA polymerase I
MLDALPYRNLVVADFEFNFGGHASFEGAGRSGERQRPVAMVAKELRTGQEWRLFRGEFGSKPPFPIDRDTLFIAYYASAELGCFRALGWPKPANILDLFTEFRDRTNGLPTLAGASLIGALTHFGLDGIGADEKDSLRARILSDGPWSDEEPAEFLDYCATDTAALERLLPVMLPRIDLPRALLRGRYMAAAAAMEFCGVPIDVPMLELFRENWDRITDALIREIDVYGVFDGRTFKADRWCKLLAHKNTPWPLLESGRPDLSDGTFRQMAKAYSWVSPYRELRSSLSDLRLNDLAVGHDGRNRTILSAFRSRTGRNQPSNTKFIFGPSVWLRGLIKPPPGHGIAYVDWKTQEFATGAGLSGDEKMQAAYRSGNPYLGFGKQTNAVPEDATKITHPSQHELFKACVLGILFGMGDATLAQRIGRPTIVARDLMQAFRETYEVFWRWSDAAVDHAMLHGSLHTVFGWHVHVGESVNPRSLRNFPMQANAAEMLRLACCLATERGIEVCAPIHDAVLICAPLDRLDSDIEKIRGIMAEASRIVLGGFEVGTDVTVVRCPDRFQDPRGAVMWDRVTNLIAKCRLASAMA